MPEKPPSVRIYRNRDGGVTTVKVNGKRLESVYTGESCRKVYAGNGFAVKAVCEDVLAEDGWSCGSEAHPQRQNKHEVTIWNLVKGTRDEKFFCPILAWTSDYSWILMKQIDVSKTNRNDFGKAIARIRRLEKKYNLADISDRDYCQFVVIDGIPVIYDYGVPNIVREDAVF